LVHRRRVRGERESAWSNFQACRECGAGFGKPCTSLGRGGSGRELTAAHATRVRRPLARAKWWLYDVCPRCRVPARQECRDLRETRAGRLRAWAHQERPKLAKLVTPKRIQVIRRTRILLGEGASKTSRTLELQPQWDLAGWKRRPGCRCEFLAGGLGGTIVVDCPWHALPRRAAEFLPPVVTAWTVVTLDRK
jgi:hypothetical protein